MFLEYWQLAVLFGVFVAGMVHVGYSAKRQYLEEAVDNLFGHLEENGFVKFKEVVDEEGETQYELLRPITFEEK